MSRTEQVLQSFCQNRRGLLAFDEQLVALRRPAVVPSIVTSTELRRVFHERCIAATGLSTWIGGICLFEETLRQHATPGGTLAKEVMDRGMTVGVRVDTGFVPFAGDVVTDGIGDLSTRLDRNAGLGAQFAKWHIVPRSDGQIYSNEQAFVEDCDRAALFIEAAQQADLLPLVAVEAIPGGEAGPPSAISYNRFFRELISTFNGRGPSLAVLIKLDRCSGASERARCDALLKAARAELPVSIAILFLGVDDPKQLEQSIAAFGDAANLPWPIRFALGSDTQTQLLAGWTDMRANQGTSDHLLLKQVRAVSNALSKTMLVGF